ncbi:hypothetical protein D3C87_1774900 [compost metagenome]
MYSHRPLALRRYEPLPVDSTSTPRVRRISQMMWTSVSSGTLVMWQSPCERIAPARIGKAEFFAPLTGMVPTRGGPPLTISLSKPRSSYSNHVVAPCYCLLVHTLPETLR